METYRRLLAVLVELRRQDGKKGNFDKVIGELIAFWKKERSKVLKETKL